MWSSKNLDAIIIKELFEFFDSRKFFTNMETSSSNLITYGFIDVSSITATRFAVDITPILEDILEDPNARVIFSDLHGGNIYIARFLKGHYYRNAVIYHTGEKPRFNLSNLPTKGGFRDSDEVRDALIRDAEKVIRM